MYMTLPLVDSLQPMDESAYSSENLRHRKFIDYAKEITHARRGYKYCLADAYEAWVYREGDTYAMGKISYKSITDSGLSERTYNVFSPNILNGKYSHGARQHASSSVNLAKAVKNASKYLRPVSMKNLIHMSNRGARVKVEAAIDEASKRVKATARDLTDYLFTTSASPRDNKLQRELKHMVDAGYEFLDAEFGEQLKATFVALDELKQSRETNTNCFTIVDAFKSTTGKQMFRLVRDQELSWFTPDIDPSQIETYEQSDLPEDIEGKLAVLSMVADDTYVEGVGYRAAPTLYYIR
jgi:hypothetical protein